MIRYSDIKKLIEEDKESFIEYILSDYKGQLIFSTSSHNDNEGVIMSILSRCLKGFKSMNDPELYSIFNFEQCLIVTFDINSEFFLCGITQPTQPLGLIKHYVSQKKDKIVKYIEDLY
ncbi:hypothetical protein WA158_002525 [Blastocystis sp. Blastoise]